MKSRKALALTVFCLFTTGAVFAKLPPPSEEAKAKAAETKAKAGEAAKKEAELLAKSQDRVAERYIKAQKVKGVVVKPTPIAAAAPAAPAPAAKK
jgi:tRNA/tmRNA/rRNA uracil-C5-methylase (TrmA/RlmC/RlmD family)